MKHKHRHLRRAFVAALLQLMISIAYLILAITASSFARGALIIALYVLTLFVNGCIYRGGMRDGRTKT